MPKFKVEVSELTMFDVTVTAESADEAEALVVGYYADTCAYEKARGSGEVEIKLISIEHTVHDYATEVL